MSLERIRTKLKNRLQELTGVRPDLEADAASSDSLDRAFASDSATLYSVLAEHNAGETAQIYKALARIDAGTYGACEDCQKKIPATRLQALPYTGTCIECQRKNESGGRQQDDADEGRQSDG